MATVFFSYSHADEALRNELEKQLSMLKRQGLIETWHDRRIGAGQEIDGAIDAHIDTDDIILLLVSPDFLDSAYCYDIEMTRALERHRSGEAIVIPVILRPCDWKSALFGKLNATPPDGSPITKWPDRDEAFLEVVKAIRGAVARLRPEAASPARRPVQAPVGISAPAGPRSSNLRLAQAFTQRDKDRFKQETFEYIANFFENSLGEIGARNPGIEGAFRRVDANRIFATVYRNGDAVTRCTIYIGSSMFGDGICYITGEATESNSMNESLQVQADDQSLYFQSMGMAVGNGGRQKLTQEGAAEFFWDMLIAPLQRSR